MVATIQQIIGKINPELYAENGKELLKKYGSWDKIPTEDVKPKSFQEHKLVYDSTSETLEPLYFFTIDLMSNEFGLETEKLMDNFTSTPGSSHFAELGQRATIMQQNATKILGDVNNVMRSILNIIYDLREFKIRLKSYDDAKSQDKSRREAAVLSLKQIWMDKVDISKGNTSIKAMAFGQGGYQTLIDAFLISKDEKDAEKIDLNERVKRILIPRVQEFNFWVKESETELRKRYELEKTYLKSQVNSMKIYSRWAKPYLKAAQELEMSATGKNPDRNPALVKTFNTIFLELTILGKSELKIKDSIVDRALPLELEKWRFERKYFSCVLVDFKFRGIPQRVDARSPQYVFGGRTEILFNSYALNSDEIAMINSELDKSDISDVLKLVKGITDESLEKFQEDINYFLDEKDTSETGPSKEEKAKKSDESNPFLALIGSYNEGSKEAEKKAEKSKILIPDNWIEKTQLRRLSKEKANSATFNMFDIYKQAHGMVSYT